MEILFYFLMLSFIELNQSFIRKLLIFQATSCSIFIKKIMERKNFNTDKAPRMSQVFPQAVIADKFIFLSGTPGLNIITNQVISNDFEEQARQCFENIKIILEEAGSSLSKVVKTTIFMVAGNDFSLLNKVYTEYFGENSPARSAPQVMPFPGGILISVECIAML